MKVSYIHSVFHGAYGVLPEDIPTCPICGDPMTINERIELQACDMGPLMPDCLRLVHYDCANDDEDDEDNEDE